MSPTWPGCRQSCHTAASQPSARSVDKRRGRANTTKPTLFYVKEIWFRHHGISSKHLRIDVECELRALIDLHCCCQYLGIEVNSAILTPLNIDLLQAECTSEYFTMCQPDAFSISPHEYFISWLSYNAAIMMEVLCITTAELLTRSQILLHEGLVWSLLLAYCTLRE